MKKEEKTSKNEEKSPAKAGGEIYWIFGVMLAIIAISLIGFFLINQTGSIEYEGLTFEKEMLGNISFYKHTYLTEKVVRATFQVIRTGEATAVEVVMRNDPRNLKGIPVRGKIEYLPLENPVYITIDSSPGLLCEYSPIAMHELSAFLIQNGYMVKAGVSDELTAEEQNLDYITCEDLPDRMVISYKTGDSPSIVREGNCYTITVADCNILAPTEKFIIQSLVDAR